MDSFNYNFTEKKVRKKKYKMKDIFVDLPSKVKETYIIKTPFEKRR
jgi:hypothetical protein